MAFLFSSCSIVAQGSVIVRIPTYQLFNRGTIFYYYRWASGVYYKTVTGANSVMYFGGLLSNTMIQIWRWPESTTIQTFVNRPLAAFSLSTRGSWSVVIHIRILQFEFQVDDDGIAHSLSNLQIVRSLF